MDNQGSDPALRWTKQALLCLSSRDDFNANKKTFESNFFRNTFEIQV